MGLGSRRSALLLSLLLLSTEFRRIGSVPPKTGGGDDAGGWAKNNQKTLAHLNEHHIFIDPVRYFTTDGSEGILVKVTFNLASLAAEQTRPCHDKLLDCSPSSPNSQASRVWFELRESSYRLSKDYIDKYSPLAESPRRFMRDVLNDVGLPNTEDVIQFKDQEQNPGHWRLEGEISNIRIKREPITVVVAIIAVVSITAFVFAAANRADIDKTDWLLKKSIEDAEAVRNQLANEDDTLYKLHLNLAQRVENVEERVDRLEAIAAMTPLFDHSRHLVYQAVQQAFAGSLPPRVVNSSIVWNKIRAYVDPNNNIDYVYDEDPNLLYTLANFNPTDTSGLDVMGMLFVPLVRMSSVFIQAKVVAGGHFNLDKSAYWRPVVPPFVSLPLYLDASEEIATPLPFRPAACTFQKGLFIGLCDVTAISSDPAAPKYCPVPPAAEGSNDTCAWKVEKVTPDFVRYFKLSHEYIIATNRMTYTEMSVLHPAANRVVKEVTRPVNIYDARFGTLVFGNVTLPPIKVINSSFHSNRPPLLIAPNFLNVSFPTEEVIFVSVFNMNPVVELREEGRLLEVKYDGSRKTLEVMIEKAGKRALDVPTGILVTDLVESQMKNTFYWLVLLGILIVVALVCCSCCCLCAKFGLCTKFCLWAKCGIFPAITSYQDQRHEARLLRIAARIDERENP